MNTSNTKISDYDYIDNGNLNDRPASNFKNQSVHSLQTLIVDGEKGGADQQFSESNTIEDAIEARKYKDRVARLQQKVTKFDDQKKSINFGVEAIELQIDSQMRIQPPLDLVKTEMSAELQKSTTEISYQYLQMPSFGNRQLGSLKRESASSTTLDNGIDPIDIGGGRSSEIVMGLPFDNQVNMIGNQILKIVPIEYAEGNTKVKQILNSRRMQSKRDSAIQNNYGKPLNIVEQQLQAIASTGNQHLGSTSKKSKIISSKDIKILTGNEVSKEQSYQIHNPVLSKDLSPLGNGLVPKQQNRYGKGVNNKGQRKKYDASGGDNPSSLSQYLQEESIKGISQPLPQLVTGFQTDIKNIPYLQINPIIEDEDDKVVKINDLRVSQAKAQKMMIQQNKQNELLNKQREVILYSQKNMKVAKTRQPSVTNSRISKLNIQSKLAGQVTDKSKVVSDIGMTKLQSLGTAHASSSNMPSSKMTTAKATKLSNQHHKKLGQQMHREAIQRQIMKQRELLNASAHGPQYLISGTYKDIYRKILQGKYNTSNTDQHDETSGVSPPQNPTALGDELLTASANQFESFDMSRDQNYGSDTVQEGSIIENTQVGEDSYAPSTRMLENAQTYQSSKLPLIGLGYNYLASSKKNYQVNSLNNIQNSIQSNGTYSNEGTTNRNGSVIIGKTGSLSSLSALKIAQKDLDRRANSLWRNDQQASIGSLKHQKQEEFFRNYLNHEIKQIQHASAMPSLEALYAAHKNYHPTKMKINMNNKVMRTNQLNSMTKIPIREAHGHQIADPAGQMQNWHRGRASLFPPMNKYDRSFDNRSLNRVKTESGIITGHEVSVGITDNGSFDNRKNYVKMAQAANERGSKSELGKLADSVQKRNEVTPRVLNKFQPSIDIDQQSRKIPVVQGRQNSLLEAKFPSIQNPKFPRIESAFLLKNDKQLGINKQQQLPTGRHSSLMALPLSQNKTPLGTVSFADILQNDYSPQKQYNLKTSELQSATITPLDTSEVISQVHQLNLSLLQQDYEVMLQDSLNFENFPNKLQYKKSLIAQAVVNKKPKLIRQFAQDIVNWLNELNVNRIVKLPGNHVLQITRKVVRNVVMGGSGIGGNLTDRQKQNSMRSQNSPNYGSQMSSRSARSSRAKNNKNAVRAAVKKQQSQLGTSRKRIVDMAARHHDEQPRKVNVKDITFRCKDDLPFYNQKADDGIGGKIEPVYVSPHFDLTMQKMIEPKHLDELITEIESNQRIIQFDKIFLIRRLREQKDIIPLKQKDIKLIIKDIKTKNKGIKLPQHKELCTYLEQVANSLFVFISRSEVQSLSKLGILMQHLSDMLTTDIRRYRIDLHHTKIKEQEQLKATEVDMEQNMVDQLAHEQQRGRSSQQTSQQSADKKRQQGEVAKSLKQKPFQQPRSKEFFAALKSNEVLKVLNLLKSNPSLAQDCDEGRRTPLHWACQLDLSNIVQILVDFGGNLNAKDDFARKPLDETLTYAQTRQIDPNKTVIDIYEQFAQGSLKRSVNKYDESVYVKYLTPVEQVKELADFINRVNDMSTLTQKQRDDKAAEAARIIELERKALKMKRAYFGQQTDSSESDSETSSSGDESGGDILGSIDLKKSL